MVSVVLLSGLFIGMIATGLVFADTNRRNMRFQTRYLWTGFVGLVSFGGFLTVYLFRDPLYQFYLNVTNSPAIAPLPREVAIAFLLLALALGVFAVLAYGFGSRYGPLKAA
jgi:hypothetical protein